MEDDAALTLCQLATGPTAVDDLAGSSRCLGRLESRALIQQVDADRVVLQEDLELDATSLDRILPPRYEVTFRNHVESTNELASELGPIDPPRLGLVVAGEQSGGRGRYDRTWRSPPGGLWASLVDDTIRDATAAWHDQLAMTVAITDVAEVLGVTARLKWPNDVIGPAGGKLAGVLVEGRSRTGQVERTICGVGLNADIDLDQLPPRATSLAAHCGRIRTIGLVPHLLAQFDRRRADPTATRSDWRSRSATLGERVTVTLIEDELTGVATELTEEGALILETDAGKRKIAPDRCRRLRTVEE